MKEYNEMADKEILEGIKKLTNYKHKEKCPILVLAPKLGSTEPGKESKKLRVYVYGGLIGEIPTIQQEEGALADEGYLDYLPKDSEERTKLEEMLGRSGDQRIHTLFSDEYLKIIVEACWRKFTKETDVSKERAIGTELVKKYLVNTDIWVPIDIEFLIPQNWLDEAGERGKPDIILYDKRNKVFRLIELKYNNESCVGNNSLKKHYEKAMKIIRSSYRNQIVNEFFRKMYYLYKYEIISGEVWKEVLKNTDRENVGLEFGYFFIGGGVERYKNYVEKQLEDTDKNCSFLYSPNLDTDTLKNCQMIFYDEFMKLKEEV